MSENLVGTADAVTEKTCGICLEDSKDPLNLPCGHSFCDGCLDGWRSRYGVEAEMRRKCPICRARIPPSKEMVASMLTFRAEKQRLEEMNLTSSELLVEQYHRACAFLKDAEDRVGADWDGVTVLEDNRKPSVVMPEHIYMAVLRGDIKSVLKWINANRREDRVNAISSTEISGMPVLSNASMCNHLTLMTLLLQLGADVDIRDSDGMTAISLVFSQAAFQQGDASKRVRLLLSWGATFFPDDGCSREVCTHEARNAGANELVNMLESELGGRRCEIIDLTSRPELNGKTCVADEYLPNSNQYKVTLETKGKEVLVLDPDNLMRRDRTPQDCGYYIEFKNGRTIRHDFDSSEDCQAFVATLNKCESQPVVTVEAEARAEQAAAELLAELGLDNSPAKVPTSDNQAKKPKKKKGGKGKKKKK